MSIAKVELFSNNLQQTAFLFKSLSHPARLAILQFLSETQVCITGDICEELPLSRTTVNQHLAELKEAGLIRGTIEGARVNYCLNEERVKELRHILSGFLDGLHCCPSSAC